MSDFEVQQYSVPVAAGESVVSIKTKSPIDPTRTRVFSHSMYPGEAHLVNYNVGDELESRDTHSRIEIVSSTEIKVHSNEFSSFNKVVVFSTLEYIGTHGGANEFTVARGVFGLQQSELVPFFGPSLTELGVAEDDAQKLSIHSTGKTNTNPLVASAGDLTWSNSTIMFLEYRNTTYDELNGVSVERSFSGTEFVEGWEAVNWIGSNWTVIRPAFGDGDTGAISDSVVSSVVGVDHVVTIPDVGDWENAWIEANRGSPGTGDHDGGNFSAYVRKGDNTTSFKIFRPSSEDIQALNRNGTAFTILVNPDIYVLHQGQGISNGTGTLVADGPTKVIPLSTPNSISDGSPHVITVVGGLDETGNLGYHDASATFVSKSAGLKLRRTIPMGNWVEYIQVIEFDSGVAAATVQKHQIDLPEWDFNIVN